MIDVDTEIVPPGLDEDEDADEARLSIHCAMAEADDTHRAGYASLAPDADDATIAAAMVATMLGAAAMRSPGLLDALRRRIRDVG